MSSGTTTVSGVALREAILALALAAVPAPGQIPLGTAPPAPTPVDEKVTGDVDGRETPCGCLRGFLRASQQGNLKNAAAYLQIPPSLQGEREAIAHGAGGGGPE